MSIDTGSFQFVRATPDLIRMAKFPRHQGNNGDIGVHWTNAGIAVRADLGTQLRSECITYDERGPFPAVAGGETPPDRAVIAHALEISTSEEGSVSWDLRTRIPYGFSKWMSPPEGEQIPRRSVGIWFSPAGTPKNIALTVRLEVFNPDDPQQAIGVTERPIAPFCGYSEVFVNPDTQETQALNQLVGGQVLHMRYTASWTGLQDTQTISLRWADLDLCWHLADPGVVQQWLSEVGETFQLQPSPPRPPRS